MLYKIGFLISGIVLFASCGSNTPAEKQPVVKKDSVIVLHQMIAKHYLKKLKLPMMCC